MLDVPYEHRALGRAGGARYDSTVGWVFVGSTLPPSLVPYQPRAYTWPTWQQDDLMRTWATRPAPKPDPDTGTVVLRRDQLEDIRTLLIARAAGAPEFMVGSETGTGKTIVAIAAVKRMANVRNVLVVCPLSATAGWREHLKKMGDGGKRWCVINYDSTQKLLTPPASALTAKRVRTKNLQIANQGTPKVQWDVVVTDEAHKLANPESQTSRISERLALTPSAPFLVRMSATAGANPAQLAYLHRGFAWQEGRTPAKSITMEQYEQWCVDRGISVTKGAFGNTLKWDGDESQLTQMNALIFGGKNPWGIRRCPDWPDQQRIPLPVELSWDERNAYESEWADFKNAMTAVENARKRAASTHDARSARAVATARAKGLAAQIRYRQKAGQVRAVGTAQFVASLIEKGKQVAVSCEYLGTVQAIYDALVGMGVNVTTFTGENANTREEERIAYQQGRYQAILYTPTESFNLHAGETMVSGNTVPRVTVIAEPRWSPKKALQAEGRSQRNGTDAPAYYCYAVDTVETKVISTVIEGMKNMSIINGDDDEPFRGLAEALGTHTTLAGVA